MDSSTKIKNIIATDHEKVEILLSSLKDTLIDETIWILICLLIFEFFLIVTIGIWVFFIFGMLKKKQQKEEEGEKKEDKEDEEEEERRITEERNVPPIMYE